MSTNSEELKNKISAGQQDAVVMEPTIVARIHEVNDALTSLIEEHPGLTELLHVKQNMLAIVDDIQRKIKVKEQIKTQTTIRKARIIDARKRIRESRVQQMETKRLCDRSFLQCLKAALGEDLDASKILREQPLDYLK